MPAFAAAGPDPKAVESFARDLLSLIRNVRVYPTGHPFLREVCERLLAGVEADLPAPLEVGVTNGELVVGGAFYGGAGSRAEQLAALLHGRRLLRLVWSRGTSAADAERLAAVLSRDDLRAAELCRTLLEAGVNTVVLEPLELERIHRAFRPGPAGAPGKEDAARARQAWQWLLHDDVGPEQLVAALGGDDRWDPAELGDEDAAALAGVLVRAERKLERALGGLSGERRDQVLARLVEVGRRVPVAALARTLAAADASGGLHGTAVSALGRGLDEDRLVDLLAALVTDQGKSTRRLVDVYRRFAPSGGPNHLLPVVQARLAAARGDPFSAEVWQTLEQFLFSLDEDPFMGQEYAQALERLAAEGGAEEPWDDLAADADEHLDRVAVALAWEDPDGVSARLLGARLEQRVEALDPVGAVRLLAAVQEHLPRFLDHSPELVRLAVDRVCGELREVSPEQRREVAAFVRVREAALVDHLLRRLAAEGRIAGRRFLVDLLAAMSPATTPAVVSRMRGGPWYVTRNLALALGGRRDPAAAPALRGLLEHDHPKVRKAALAALGMVGGDAAVAALRAFAADPSRPGSERAAARRALGGTAAGDSDP